MTSNKSKDVAIFRVASGNFLKMYNFMVYDFYAIAIAKTFFPGDDLFAFLMLFLAIFGAGFLMRPLGAMFLSAYVGCRGRRQGLIIALGPMATGTLLIAFVPDYATLSVTAPLLVLFGRLLQGFSAGVELGGVSVYLSEIATPGRKGFFVNWQSASQQVVVVFAGLPGALLNQWLSPQDMGEWGWYVPFFISCLTIPALFVIRRLLEEMPEFEARTRRSPLSQVLRSIGQNFGVVLAGTAMVVMTIVSFHLITAYTPTFGKNELQLSDLDNLLVTMRIGLSNFIWLPVMGAFSDRIGRKPLLLGASALTLLTAYPALSQLVREPSFAGLLGIELWLSFLYSSYNGVMAVALTEVMPADVRTTGLSLAHSLATAAFGGFTPAVCTWLIHTLDNRAAPGIWLSGATLLGLFATLVLFHRRGKEIAEAEPANA